MPGDAQIRRIMPNLAAPKLPLYLPALNQATQVYGVNTALRTSAFIAQLAHESGEFRRMEEIWGPTDAQRHCKPPSALAAKLGNTEAGDGKRYKKCGPIQITGRCNDAKYGSLLGIDPVADPALAATPEVASATAGLYRKANGLNEPADTEQFITIARRINGGTNGLPDRQNDYATAKAVLAPGFNAGAVTRGARKAALTSMCHGRSPVPVPICAAIAALLRRTGMPGAGHTRCKGVHLISHHAVLQPQTPELRCHHPEPRA